MPNNDLIEEHYTHGILLEAIREGIASLGKTEASVTLRDLGRSKNFISAAVRLQPNFSIS